MHAELKIGRGETFIPLLIQLFHLHLEKENQSWLMTIWKHTYFFNGKVNYTEVFKNKMLISEVRKHNHLLGSKLCQKICFGWVEYALWNQLFTFQATVISCPTEEHSTSTDWLLFSCGKEPQTSCLDVIPFNRRKNSHKERGPEFWPSALRETVMAHLALLGTEHYYINFSPTHG